MQHMNSVSTVEEPVSIPVFDSDAHGSRRNHPEASRGSQGVKVPLQNTVVKRISETSPVRKRDIRSGENRLHDIDVHCACTFFCDFCFV